MYTCTCMSLYTLTFAVVHSHDCASACMCMTHMYKCTPRERPYFRINVYLHVSLILFLQYSWTCSSGPCPEHSNSGQHFVSHRARNPDTAHQTSQNRELEAGIEEFPASTGEHCMKSLHVQMHVGRVVI